MLKIQQSITSQETCDTHISHNFLGTMPTNLAAAMCGVGIQVSRTTVYIMR